MIYASIERLNAHLSIDAPRRLLHARVVHVDPAGIPHVYPRSSLTVCWYDSQGTPEARTRSAVRIGTYLDGAEG